MPRTITWSEASHVRPQAENRTRTQGNNKPLKDGAVKPKTFDFAFEEVDPHHRRVPAHGARQRVRHLRDGDHDLYLRQGARQADDGGAGLHRARVPSRRDPGQHQAWSPPKDLEGKKVGVNRGYTVTTGVWARGILQDEHGVDLSKITWVLSGDEHVAEYKAPSNVVPIEKGKDMAEMLASGELAAAIGIESKSPDVAPLIPNAQEAGLKALRERGHYPINHCIVIKDELIAKYPDLAVDVFNTFAESKRHYLRAPEGRADREADGGRQAAPAGDGDHRRSLALRHRAQPQGARRLLRHATTQGIVTIPLSVDELFAPSTRGLVG